MSTSQTAHSFPVHPPRTDIRMCGARRCDVPAPAGPRCHDRIRLLRRLTLLCGAAVLAAPVMLHAAPFVWDGGGVDTNFSTAANWNPDGAPPDDGTADLHFAGSNHTTPNAETGYLLNSITFDTGAAAFTVGGQTLELEGGGLTNNSANTQTINSQVLLAVNQTWNFASGAGTLNLGNTVEVASAATWTLGTGTLSLTDTGTYLIVDGAAGTTGVALSGTAKLTDVNVVVGFTNAGFFNQTGGTHTVSGNLILGYPGDGQSGATSNGSYTLSGTGQLNTSVAQIGNIGTATFTQTAGTHTNTGGVLIGLNGGTGSYSLSGTAQLSTVDVYVGYSGASTATFTQSGGTHTASDALYLGYGAGTSGTYALSVGTLNTATTYVGYTDTGIFNQSGGTHTVTTTLFVGFPGDGNSGATSNGSYTLSGTGQLNTGTTQVGNTGTGTFNQTGGTHIVSGGSGLLLGLNGGSGSYSLSGTGTLTTDGTQVGNTGTGTFTQTGGTHTDSNGLLIGVNAGSGTYSLSAGQLSTGGTVVGYSGAATATFTQTGGTHAPASGVDIADPSGSAGTYNLSGGTLSTSSVFGNAGNSTFNFNGGTLQATAANTGFLSALTRSNVRNAGAVFDTNGFNVTVSQVLSHSDLGSLNNTAVVTGGGTGYLAPPIVTVSGGGGYGATATAVVAGGSVTNVILSGGSNYTSTPALTFSGGGGTGAGATALFTPDNSTDGGLAKNGSGTLTLAGASTYTGVTNINAGNLRVDNTAGSATGTGTVLVNSNATVGGTGTIAGPTVVGPNAGAIATLDPGNGAPGRLTFSSSLAITPNARFNVKIGGTTAGTTYDQVRVGGALTLLGNLNVNLTGGFVPSVGQTFYILDDTGTASPTGTFANAPGGIYTDSTGTVYTVTYASHDPADMSNSDLNDVSLTVVPEPASLGLLALGSLCLLARRRRDR